MSTNVSTTGHCHQSDVILFCGPPHVGKTRYYHGKLADRYTRVSPKELFKAHKGLSLRELTNQHVVEALRQGGKVVIDDENQTRKRRESFVRIIKQKCPKVKVECLCFRPCHGVAQLQWAQEFHNAWCVERGIIDAVHTAEMIDRCEQQMESPSDAEGFHVTGIKTYLTRDFYPRSEVPALFVQWEAIVTLTGHATDVTLTDGATEALSLWYSCNPCGRIIIICDGITTRGGDRDGQLRHTLAELGGHMTDCPVYMLVLDDVSGVGAFSLPPQPGILAFLVQLHHIDIESKATKYLYKTTSHMTMAANAGVRYIKASRVFQHPHLVKTDHAVTKPHVPDVLEGIQKEEESTTGILAPAPSVPLYEVGMKATDSICQVKLACWRSLFLGCKDKAILQRYNDLYQDIASTPISSSLSQKTHDSSMSVSSNVSPTTRKRNLPSWMLLKRNKKSSQNKDILIHGDAVVSSTHSPSGSLDTNTVYVMSEEEMVSAARHLLQQVTTQREKTRETSNLNLATCKIGVTDNELIGPEGHTEGSLTKAQMVTAGSSVPANKRTLDSENDHHQDDPTLMILDDLFEVDHSHHMKPPTRLRRHHEVNDTELSDIDTARAACDKGTSSLGHSVIAISDDRGQLSPEYSVTTTSVDTGQLSPVHSVTTMSFNRGQLSPAHSVTRVTTLGEMLPTSSATLQLLQETVILLTQEINTTSPKHLSVPGRHGKDRLLRAGNKRGCVGVRVASEGVEDTVSVSPNSDVKLTERAKRRRFSSVNAPDLSILDDLI